MAKCYQKGLGCPKNETLAFKLFKIVAGEGDFQSLYEVAVCYLYGIGVEKNPKEAFICFTMCKDQGIEEANDALACCMLDGIGTTKNEEAGIELLQYGVTKEYPISYYNLSLCYALGKGVEKNEETAFELLEKSAGLEYGEAQYYLGKCYEFANMTTIDYKKAKYWYKRATNTYPLAHVALADLFFDGHGTKICYNKANKLYKRAYKKGIKEAELGYALSCLFIKGKEETGVETLKTIYDVNSYVINQMLGLCYEYNIGTQRDTDKSKKFLKAAELIKNMELGSEE